MDVKELTIAEVATHNTREDLYLIIRDEVYAVSKFVTEVSFNINLMCSFASNFGTDPHFFLFCSIQVRWAIHLLNCHLTSDFYLEWWQWNRLIRLIAKGIIKWVTRNANFLCSLTGGEEILIEYAGKDSTEAFDDVGHSQDAKDLLKQYHVGTIVASERASNKKKQKEETKRFVAIRFARLVSVRLFFLCFCCSSSGSWLTSLKNKFF